MRSTRGTRRAIHALSAVLLAAGMLLLTAASAAGVIEVDAALYPVQEDGWYDTMCEVAVYIDSYQTLPDNYLTKREAQALGWEASRGNLWTVADGCSIGGDRFGNYEGSLPEAKGRSWKECDIGYQGGYRGGERIVFSNDGLIYYTDDHYKTFDEVRVVRLEEGATTEDDGWTDILNWLWGG
ncbi:MAG: ribonuclease domain-containing protein [Clostridia bacterium]|nr:ribonuclease domain-containing protein [Clostridia bacterium]